MDMTYRANGDKVVVYRNDDGPYYLISNIGTIAELEGIYSGFPRITTNAFNKQDIFVCWDSDYDLDGDSSDETALFVQELNP